ncbi:solute carrier organic anion transporter family member 6A1 [Camelus dromedarius]|uniref:solute carrier organic anion transporter family member 6A1 n=1 Tax=Camelus dromedarius TaxID=9838 RepID=UPI003119410A
MPRRGQTQERSYCGVPCLCEQLPESSSTSFPTPPPPPRGSKELYSPGSSPRPTVSRANCQPPHGTSASCPRRNVPSGGLGCGCPVGPHARASQAFRLELEEQAALRQWEPRPRPARPARTDVSQDPAPAGPRSAMQEDLAEVEPKASQAKPAEVRKPLQAREAGEENAGLRTVPASQAELQEKESNLSHTSPSSTKKVQEQQKESLEGLCGLGCVVIPRCPCFNNVRFFLVFFCILVISQGIVFGLVNLSSNSFQDNHLTTIGSLVLSLSYDISFCLVVVFIAYCGGKGNIPRWIAVSSFLVGFGSLLFAFPYLSGRNYQMNVVTEDICKEVKIVNDCKKTSLSFLSKDMIFFILGQSVQGIAGVPLRVLGIVFIYNSVAAYSAGIYLGIVEASGILGYALGRAIGALLIKTSENSSFEESIEDCDASEHWLWTWWSQFVIISVIAWSTLIPLSRFPQSIRGTARIKPEKQKPHLLDENQTKDQEFVPSLKDLFATAVILIKSPMFVCLSLARASESLVIIGTSALLPVYIESQFMLTPSDATTLSRFILILGDAIGQFLGGIIVYTMRMSCKCLMRFVMVTAVVSLVAFALIIFVHCDPIPFAGFNEDYGGTGHLGNLTAPCNSHCKCSSSFYSSTCGRDDIVYFSPCFAGCTHSKTLKDSKTYYNCSCIKDGIPTLDNQGDFIDARRGNCDAKCYELPLFAAFIFSALVFSGLSDIPNILTILWIIPDKQRSLALGVTCVILRLFGTIPGRIVFKILRDNSCIFGDAEHRGGSRNCWIYNKTKMMYLLVGACK